MFFQQPFAEQVEIARGHAGFRGIGLHVHIMQAVGIVMMLLFFHLYFAPWRRFRVALSPPSNKNTCAS